MATRFFARLFDAVQREEDELLAQVTKDLKAAQGGEVIESSELTYRPGSKGEIEVVDKASNEVTKAYPVNAEFRLESDDNSFLIPQLIKSIDALKDTVEKANEKPAEEPKEDKPEDSEVTQKEESSFQPDAKVIVTLDGVLTTAHVVEVKDDEGSITLRIPKLQNKVITVPLDCVSVPTQADAEKVETTRITDSFKTFAFVPKKSSKFVQKAKKFSVARKFKIVELQDSGKSRVLAECNSQAEAENLVKKTSTFVRLLKEGKLDIQ